MNDRGFEELMESVRWMGRHMRGEEEDRRTTKIPYYESSTVLERHSSLIF